MGRSLCAGLVALLAALLAAGPGAAQHGLPPPEPGRPLDVRLAEADRVAIGRVAELTPGRAVLDALHPLRGALPERITIKQAPSDPHPLVVGERILALLRGAREPYVLADDPVELVVLRNAEEEAAWVQAVGDLDAAEDPGAREQLYRAWLDAAPPSLQRSALRGLGEGVPGSGLHDEDARRIVAVALDPERTATVRRAAAEVASLDPAARARLLAALPGDSGMEPSVIAIAVSRSTPEDRAQVERVLVEGLVHPRREVRRVVVRLSVLLPGSAALEQALTFSAEEDDDAEIRALARRSLDRRHPPGS